MRALSQAVLASLAMWGAVAAHANGWQDTPDALHLQAMGDSLRMNGTPMTIRSFTTSLALETVLHDVRANWERPGNGPVKRSKLPAWIVLNQSVGEQHRSLQVRQNGNLVEGFVALTSPKETREPKLALRMPAQVTALQVVDSVDQGKASQQIIAVSRRSIDATAIAFDDALKADGWQRQMSKKRGRGTLISASRGDQQFDAVLSAQKAGALVMISVVQ